MCIVCIVRIVCIVCIVCIVYVPPYTSLRYPIVKVSMPFETNILFFLSWFFIFRCVSISRSTYTFTMSGIFCVIVSTGAFSRERLDSCVVVRYTLVFMSVFMPRVFIRRKDIIVSNKTNTKRSERRLFIFSRFTFGNPGLTGPPLLLFGQPFFALPAHVRWCAPRVRGTITLLYVCQR